MLLQHGLVLEGKGMLSWPFVFPNRFYIIIIFLSVRCYDNIIIYLYFITDDKKQQNIYSSDDDGSDLEARRPRKGDKRALADSDEEEEDEKASDASASGSDES